MYTTVAILRNFIYAAVAKGVDFQGLCESVGLTPADLHLTEKRVEGLASISRFWEYVVAATGDPFFALHVGEQYNPAIMGLVGYLMQNSPTVKEAILTLQQNQKKVSGWVSYELKASGKGYEISYIIDPLWERASPYTARHANESAMSCTLQIMRMLSGQKFTPLKAEFTYSNLPGILEYQRVLGCPVHFEKAHNKLYFRKTDLELPVLNSDQSLYGQLHRLLTEGQEPSQPPGFTNQVRNVLMKDFKGQVPPLEVVAAHLHLSTRTFQRKLTIEGTTYRSVGAQLKKELAVSLLQHTDAKVNTIAEVLGYSEPSAFRKAFKEWTNTTPRHLKKDNISSTGAIHK
jgi:AraC-like DNA-binding protein